MVFVLTAGSRGEWHGKTDAAGRERLAARIRNGDGRRFETAPQVMQR